MDAQGFKRQTEDGTVICLHLAVLDQPPNLRSRCLRVGKHCPRLRPRRQGSVSPVATVRKSLRGKRNLGRPRRTLHRGSGSANQAHWETVGLDGPDQPVRQYGIRFSLVVEGAMRFDVLDFAALGAGNGFERSNLIENEVDDLLLRQPYRTPAEPLEVRVTRMRPNADSMTDRKLHRSAHDFGIAGMTATRDIRRADERHERGVIPHLVRSERLADISIEVECTHNPMVIPLTRRKETLPVSFLRRAVGRAEPSLRSGQAALHPFVRDQIEAVSDVMGIDLTANFGNRGA